MKLECQGETDRYEELRDFLQNRMQMSHIYQPVMLMTGIVGQRRTVPRDSRSLSALLSQDPTQVEYYTKVTEQYGWSRAVKIRHSLVDPGSGSQRVYESRWMGR